MNEAIRLRTKHLDYGEWEDGDEHYDEVGEDDDWGQWYRDETGYPDAAGVGTIDYDERVRRAAAPLKRTSDYHGQLDWTDGLHFRGQKGSSDRRNCGHRACTEQ